jgi:hypothetical protein
VLLTRSPLGVTRCCHRMVLARLACVRHAASVHPEPGSNSPSEIVNVHAPGGSWGVLEGARWPWSHSSLTIRPGRTGGMGDARANPCTARGSSVIRMRQGTVPREASPPRDGVLALAFRTLLSFQGTSPGCSSATHLRFPRRVAAGAAGRYHGPFKIVKDFPPVRSAYSWWSTAAMSSPSNRSAALRPNRLGVRTATEQPSDRLLWRSATSCLPMAAPEASSRRGPRS